MDFFGTAPGRVLIALCILLSVALMAFSLNHPLEQMPSWSKLSIVPSVTVDALYHAYFLKYKLGPGRIVDITTLLISGMALLTTAWIGKRCATG